MAKSNSHAVPTRGDQASPNRLAVRPLSDRLLLVALTALFVGRPLLASEGVSWVGDGLPWVMAWFVLAAAIVFQAMHRDGLPTPLGSLDAAALALIAWHTLAATAALGSGSPRPAVNMLWEWIGMGLGFFCARQLVRDSAIARGLAAAMLSLAVGLAAIGYEQVFVEMPADQAAFQHAPDAVLRAAGWDYAAGTVERKQFQDRLNSPEPVATFALANSLAGYMAPWFIVAIGLLISAAGAPGASGASPIDRAGLARLGIVAAAIGGCLLLTHCRGAWVGVFVACGGLATLAWLEHGQAVDRLTRARHIRWIALAVGLAFVAAVAALVFALAEGMAGNLVAGARKSLGYRLEYWQASWAMIRDNPWLGCGPGNFQDCYTAFKLPAASEEIRDPHNFIVELAATAGIPAALAMLAVVGLFFLQFARRGIHSAGDLDPSTSETQARGGSRENGGSRALSSLFAWGGLAGIAIAKAISLFDIVPLTWGRMALLLVGAALAWRLLAPWTRGGVLRRGHVAMAVLGMLVHLLAAGGIGFPGVAGSLWLLIALGSVSDPPTELPRNQPPISGLRTGRRLVPILLLTAIACGGFACFVTAYQPVLASAALMQRALDLEAKTPREASERLLTLLAATRADSLSGDPPRALARQLAAELLAVAGDDPERGELERRFHGAVDAWLRLRPRSSSAWLEAARYFAEIYQHDHITADRSAAEHHAERAEELYPNSARTRAVAADIYDRIGRPELAGAAARESLRLDALTPHLDKKLDAADRSRMQSLAANPP